MALALKRGSLTERLLRRAFRAVFTLEAPPSACGASTLPPTESAEEPIRVLEDPEILVPGLWNRTIVLGQCRWRWGHPYHDNELILLCHLSAAGYRPIVEFGTFDGRTAFNLAMNAGTSTVTTIDLPGADDGSNLEGALYGPYESGRCIASAPPEVRSRITQIQADSRAVDLSHLCGRVGLVFVDGGHSEAVCRHDSEAALRLIRPGGIVVWDDYTPYWPGVKRVLDEIACRLPLHHFPRFGVVMYQSPG